MQLVGNYMLMLTVNIIVLCYHAHPVPLHDNPSVNQGQIIQLTLTCCLDWCDTDTVTIALTFPLTGEAQTASLGRPTSSAARPRTAPLRSVPRRPARTARSTSSRVVASAIAAGRSPTGYSAQSFDFGLDGLSSLAGDQAPLDPAMAARTVTAGDGGYQMVTAVNSQFEVTNLDSGYFELGSSGAQPLSNFGQGLPFAGSYSYRSPGVFWDLDQQRWVLVLTAAVPDGDTSDPPAFILLAVSQTDDAIGSWWVYALPAAGGLAACPGSAYAAPDYTQATYDVNGIYITTQITCNGVASQSAILAVPKAAAYDGSLARYAVYSSAAMVAALPAAQKSALAPTAAAAFAPWPALPQAKEDVGALAYFVTQVSVSVCGWDTSLPPSSQLCFAVLEQVCCSKCCSLRQCIISCVCSVGSGSV
jgi:hypothetical protein